MIDFGGWDMPVQYAGLIAEHRACRAAAGLFDVSHMGEVRVTGPRAIDAVDRLVTNDVTKLAVGRSLYAAITNHRGGIVDDIFVYRLGAEDLLICVNASNREKDFAWLSERNPFPGDAVFVDQGDDWAQVAIQGRRGPAIAQSLTGADLSGVTRGGIVAGDFAGAAGCWLARTGYTGEDGYEVFIPAAVADAALFQRVLAAGADEGMVPVGLGARDTLRLEVRNVLYGNDIGDDTSPLEAGLRWITKLDKPAFTGRDVLIAQREAGLTRRLVGLVVEGRIPRPHCPIQNAAGEVIGEVTSGTRSPSLGTRIAMGYVARGNGRPGTKLTVDVRGRMAAATVVKGPFYKRDY